MSQKNVPNANLYIACTNHSEMIRVKHIKSRQLCDGKARKKKESTHFYCKRKRKKSTWNMYACRLALNSFISCSSHTNRRKDNISRLCFSFWLVNVILRTSFFFFFFCKLLLLLRLEQQEHFVWCFFSVFAHRWLWTCSTQTHRDHIRCTDFDTQFFFVDSWYRHKIRLNPPRYRK